MLRNSSPLNSLCSEKVVVFEKINGDLGNKRHQVKGKSHL